MPEPKVRKLLTVVEDVYHEGGTPVETPLRRGAILAVIENPFAGSYHEKIDGFMKDLEPLGLSMANRLVSPWRQGQDRRLRQGRHRRAGRRTGTRRALARAGRIRHARRAR